MAYYDFVSNIAGSYGLVGNSAGTTYCNTENQQVIKTLPSASGNMFVAIRYELPQSGNYIYVDINDVRVFSWTYNDGSAAKEVMFKLKRGDVLKITVKSYRTGGTMAYYTFYE